MSINTFFEFNDLILFNIKNQKIPIEVFFKKNNFLILKKFKKNKKITKHNKFIYLLTLINLIFKKGMRIKFFKIILSALNYILLKIENKINFKFNQLNFIDLVSIISNNTTPNLLLFSFTSVKLDKTRKKNSRGKLPHFFLLWKYVPLYKRNQIFYKLLSKEIKFIKVKGIKKKLSVFFDSLIYKIFFYVNNYQNFINKLIFKKYMGSLFINYKTKK